MPLVNKGLTLPNRQWDLYSPAELAALEDLAPNNLVWPLYGGQIDRDHKRQLDPFITAHQPGLIYRPYADDIAQRTAIAWATICYQRILNVGHLGELIPWNEPNVEGMGEDWPRQIAWLKAFAAAWRATMMDDPLHLPALSPNGTYRAGYDAYQASGLFVVYDAIDFHCYQQIDFNPVARFTALGLRCDITEFNQVDPGWAFRGADIAGVRSCTWFILGGTADQAAHDILKQPIAYQSFKAWRPHVPNPTPNPTAIDVGQGVKDAMAAHGDAPTTNEHYLTDAKGFTFKSETCGTKGKCEWWKETNRTVYIPFA